MKNLTLKLLLISGLLYGCSSVQTLNLKSHTYSKRAKNIIWFQIAGLQEEQLAMLKFTAAQGQFATAFEEMSCIGKVWNYNLYNLRPDAGAGFLSQTVGSKNIKGTCSDYSQKPAWDYANKSGYKVGILESAPGKFSFSKSRECKEGEGFIGNAILWKMEKNNSNNKFHYLGSKTFKKGEIYYDKSCKSGDCFATIFDNVKSLWNIVKKEQGQTIFIVRDFSYLKALEKKNIPRAREILLDINKSIEFFYQEFSRDNETLFLVTSSGALNIEMPKQGKEWFDFEKKGKFTIFRNRSLMSPAFAKGPGAENFCGIFEEYEMVKRIFWTTGKKTWNPLSLF